MKTCRVALLPLFICLSIVRVGRAADLNSAAESRAFPSPGPTALAMVDQSLVAAGRAGSLTIIDPAAGCVVGRSAIGSSLSDLVPLRRGHVLVTDQADHMLLLVQLLGERAIVRTRLPTPHSPVSVRISPDGGRCSVASLWSRRVSLFRIAAGTTLEATRTIDLPFAPRLQCYLPDGATLVVADAFGGRLAVIDAHAGGLIGISTLDGHNIRGLVMSHDGALLLAAHQKLHGDVPTTRRNVSTASVIDNRLSAIPVSRLMSAIRRVDASDALTGSVQPISVTRLDDDGPAGDPGAMLASAGGRRIVCLGGVQEIALLESDGGVTRVDVGRRPAALAVDERREQIHVANLLDDSISVIDKRRGRRVDTIWLGRRPRPSPAEHASPAEHGERLFYDARLSSGGSFSCHSCHTDGHTNGLLSDNFADGGTGSPKRILSLLGTEHTEPWAWNGQRAWLLSQVHASLRSTMRAEEAQYGDGQKVAALSEFLCTLKPPPGLRAARNASTGQPAVQRGRELFANFACDRCHVPPRFTSMDVYDVGLAAQTGRREFNPPSLLGVSQLNAWLHDNRADGLAELFTQFGHPNGDTLGLAPEEVRDLVAFLESL